MINNYSYARNKTIEELKRDILVNKKHLDKIHSKKNYLIKVQTKEKGPLEFLYAKIFDNTQEEITQCDWEEETVKESLVVLEKEKRMKELATVNEWWKAHEETIKTFIHPDELQEFKASVFHQLVEELEKDEAAFMQAADKILFNLNE